MASIYSKPVEFHWAIRKIEVMKPIRYLFCKRNEVKVKASATNPQPIDTDAQRTQRTTMFLKDVHYRVTASLIPKKAGPDVEASLRHQALRRIEQGQCFAQPYLGMRECVCYFALADMTKSPIQESQDFGLMVFDTHIPWDASVGKTECDTSLYHCKMVNGVIDVPDYSSPEVLKIGGSIFV